MKRVRNAAAFLMVSGLILLGAGCPVQPPGQSLTFTFDSPECPWTPAEITAMEQVLGIHGQLTHVYAKIVEYIGEPAFPDNTVNIRKLASARYPGLSGHYDPIKNEMQILIDVNPPGGIAECNQSIWKHLYALALTHETVHAFYDDYALALDQPFFEGIADAVTILVNRDLHLYDFWEASNFGDEMQQLYEIFNVPYATRSNGNIVGSNSFFRKLGYRLSAYVFGKLYLEDNDFFRRFNQLLFQKPSDHLLSHAELRDLVQQSKLTFGGNVEGIAFADWYDRQHVLNHETQQRDYFTMIWPYWHYFFAKNGVNTQGVPNSSYSLDLEVLNFSGTTLLRSSTVKSCNEPGCKYFDEPALTGYTGRVEIVMVSPNGRGGPLSSKLDFVKPDHNPAGIYGIVLPEDTGVVILSQLDPATGAVISQTAKNVVNGWFAADELSQEGTFEIVFSGGGRRYQKTVTKGARPYFVPIDGRPQIEDHFRVEVGIEGKVLSFRYKISDNEALASATLYYKPEGAPHFEPIPFVQDLSSRDMYQADVPADLVRRGPAEYYVEAVDSDANRTVLPFRAPEYVFQLRVIPDLLFVDAVNGSSSGDGSKERPYETIAAALAQLQGIEKLAPLGRRVRINVLPGTYQEAVSLRPGVGLVALQGASKTEIVGGVNMASYSTLRGFKVMGGTTGIDIHGSSAGLKDIVVEHNVVIGNSWGIAAYKNLTNLRVEHNTITQNRWYGLQFYNEPGTIVRHNIIVFNSAGQNFPQFIREVNVKEGRDLRPEFAYNNVYNPRAPLLYEGVEDATGKFGNLSQEVVFQDQLAFKLASGSPGIDDGDPAVKPLAEPQPNGGRVDLGAYGNTPEATMSPYVYGLQACTSVDQITAAAARDPALEPITCEDYCRSIAETRCSNHCSITYFSGVEVVRTVIAGGSIYASVPACTNKTQPLKDTQCTGDLRSVSSWAEAKIRCCCSN